MKGSLSALGLAGVLAGCATLPQATGTPPLPPARSPMTAASPKQDLLYISDLGTNDVYVYSYPQRSLVGTLSGFNSPVRVCSDTAGNVFVTNTYAKQILEYAHGGSQPIATFHDKGFLPVGCSVDPTTGTLAVTNYGPSGSNRGSVTIFDAGKARGKIYNDPSVLGYLFCAYDDAGNLFVDGLNSSYNWVLIELPRGAKKFERLTLNQSFTSWGGIQWDGKYLAIGDGVSTISDYAIKGRNAKRVRTIVLHKAVDVQTFWISGSTIVGPDGPNGGNHDAGIWKYPGGGAPKATVGSGTLENPSGATISIAP
jgi:hypothetical protein